MTDPKEIIGKKSRKKTEEEKENPDTHIDEMPQVTEKPDVKKIEAKRKSVPDSMSELRGIMNSINDTNVQDINDTLQKNADFEASARQLWVVKESEKLSFTIKMKVPVDARAKTKKWKRENNGKPVYENKEFHYGGLTITEKDIHTSLLMEREMAKFELAQMTMKLKTDPTAENKFKFMEQSHKIYQKVQKYNTTVFKDYFGATDDDIERMNLDDIINYNDVAVYIEGTRHPQ